jgi:hypothetical protein
MILLLDAIDCESLDHIGRVEAAHMIFVEMDQAKLHQLAGLAMSQIGEGLAHVRAAHVELVLDGPDQFRPRNW